MREDVLVDSSFLYALYAENDLRHDEALLVTQLIEGRLLIPQVMLGEAAFLFRRERNGLRLAAEFMRVLSRDEPFLIDVTTIDLDRAAEIMLEYEEAKFDFVDCCLMALSERLNITTVCTFDERDFGIFRPKHVERLELLP